MEAEAEEEKEMDIRQLQEGEESSLGAVLSLTAVWEERQLLVGRNKHTQDSRERKGRGNCNGRCKPQSQNAPDLA